MAEVCDDLGETVYVPLRALFPHVAPADRGSPEIQPRLGKIAGALALVETALDAAGPFAGKAARYFSVTSAVASALLPALSNARAVIT